MPTSVPAIDTKSRSAVVQAYTDYYLPTVGVTIGWTGDLATCVPGATSSAYRDATLIRLNYYRAMSGLNGDTTFDATQDADWQSCALMMDANNTLDHNPPPSWLCYTAGGDAAAALSDLALDLAGAEAIGAYIDDNGTTDVAHRRWCLYQVQQTMAIGSTPGANAHGVLMPGGWGSDLAYSETDLGTGWASHPDYVRWTAWPPPRYCPYQILPASSKMWSLTAASANYAADFSAATVTMTKDNGGSSVTANIQTIAAGFGDETLVWSVPSISYGAPGSDTDYEVTVAGVKIGTRGQTQTFTYTVTVIAP